MAWPFTNVGAPNIDTGPAVAVPTSSGVVFAGALWVLGAHFTNSSAAQLTVTVTDTAGLVLCKVTIPAGDEKPYEWPFRPAAGVKWSASAAGCIGQMWGYQ